MFVFLMEQNYHREPCGTYAVQTYNCKIQTFQKGGTGGRKPDSRRRLLKKGIWLLLIKEFDQAGHQQQGAQNDTCDGSLPVLRIRLFVSVRLSINGNTLFIKGRNTLAACG